MKYYFIAVGVLLALVLVGWLGYPHSEDYPYEVATRSVAQNPYQEQYAADYQALVKQAFRETGVPGAAVVLVHDTSVLVMQGLGLRDMSEHRFGGHSHRVSVGVGIQGFRFGAGGHAGGPGATGLE